MSFHDEPMVVENGPLGLDIGEQHSVALPALFLEDPQRPGSWLRTNSELTKLLVVSKRPGADQSENFANFQLDLTKPVEISLADPPGPVINQGTLTLSFEGADRHTIRIQPTPFSLMRTGRRLNHVGQLRMTRIRFFALEGTPPQSVVREIVLRPQPTSPVTFGTVIAMFH